MSSQRTVMFVHAHPDDETTKAGGLAASLAADGVRTVLVTCTDGSAGDVTDAALLGDRGLAQVRSEELAAAVEIMRFAELYELGYLDSGSDAEIADGFANMAIEPMIERLASIIDDESPDVIVTYDPAYATGHPDHLRCHDVTAAVFAATSEQSTGPKKLYGSRFLSTRRVRAMHQWMLDNQLDSPYEKALAKMPARPPERFTTRLAIGPHAVTARRALQQHRTQIALDHRWFYSIPDDAYADLYPWEELELLATARGITPTTGIESDLFTGLP